MPGLPEDKIEIVRHLVQHAPDKVVTGLSNALATAGGDTALAGVRKVVEAEIADRTLRNKVLEPVAPLFFGDPADRSRMAFPTRALPLIWRGLKAVAPAEVARAETLLADYRNDEPSPDVFNTLLAFASDGLAAGEQRDFAAAAAAIEEVRPGGVAELVSCLAIGPVVRTATQRLPDWIGRQTEEVAAAVRLAYKDASAGSDDAGPRFFEMLASQLAEPWMILRVVSSVMDRPSEAYLAGSELAFVATRLLDSIDANLKAVSVFDLNSGSGGGRAAAAIVEVLTLQVAELESFVELSRETGWGLRVQKQKAALAGVVEGRLRELEKVLGLALPNHRVRVARAWRTEPLLSREPDDKHVDRCRALLAFVEAIRPSANYGGFASTRAKVLEQSGEALDTYVEEALSLVRDDEVEDRDIAARYLKIAAEFASLIHEPRAGDIVRRRAATAFGIRKPGPPVYAEDAAKPI